MNQKTMRDIMKRFHPEMNETNNDVMEQDPKYEIFKALPEELVEEVDYERPHFKMPARSSKYSHTFCLQGQAVSTLKKQGFLLEEKQLSCALDHLNISYDETMQLLYRFLDFARPAESPQSVQDEEVEAFLKAQGIKVSLLELKQLDAQKRKLENNLKTPTGSLTEQMQWLKSNAHVSNPFGKDALFYLADESLKNLSQYLWEQSRFETGVGPAVQDPMLLEVQKVYPNIEAFLEDYPMGFLHLDVLQSSVVGLKAIDNPALSLALAQTSLQLAGHQHWDTPTVARLGWDHKDLTGVCANALWGQAVADYAIGFLLPALGAGTKHLDGSCLASMVQALSGSTQKTQEDAVVGLMGVYAHMHPENYTLVKEALLEGMKDKKVLRSEQERVQSVLEKVEISSALFGNISLPAKTRARL